MTSFSPSYQVHIKSPLVVNGVCVRWKGYFDMERLDGVACMEFDEEAAKIEDVILREQVEAYNRRMKEFEEYRKAQQRHIAAFMGQQHALQQAAAAAAAAQHQASSTPTAAEASSTSVMASEPSSKSNGQIHSAADLVDIEEVSRVFSATSRSQDPFRFPLDCQVEKPCVFIQRDSEFSPALARPCTLPL